MASFGVQGWSHLLSKVANFVVCPDCHKSLGQVGHPTAPYLCEYGR